MATANNWASGLAAAGTAFQSATPEEQEAALLKARQADATAAAAAAGNPASGGEDIGVAFGGQPGTAVPGHPGMVIGPDGQVHDLNGPGRDAFGAGSTATDLNLYDPNFGNSNLADAAGLNNLGEPVVNDPTVPRAPGFSGNVAVGNAAPAPAPYNGTTATGNTVPGVAPGTLVPGLANTSDLTHRDPRDYQYGRDAGYGQQVVGQARNQATAFGTESRAIGQAAADTGAAYGEQTAAAGQRGQEVGAGIQQSLGADAALAAARGATTNSVLQNQGANAADAGGAINQNLSGAGQTAQNIGGAANANLSASGQAASDIGANANAVLSGLEATEGPSAAQATLDQATSQGMNNALTLARSGRGVGGSAAAAAAAAGRMPGMAASAATASAQLRANENALWRARQAQNVSAGGQLALEGQKANASALSAGANAALSGSGQNISAIGAGGQAVMQGQGLNIDATKAGGQQALEGINSSIGAKTAGGQAALAGTSQGMQGAQAGGDLALHGLQQQTGNVQNAQGQFWQGESLADKVTGAQSQQDLAYENMLTQKAGIDAGIAINAANNEQSIWPAVIGAGATGLAMMASDERNKDVDREVKLSSAIHGNPYGRTGAPGKDIPEMKGPRSDLSPYGGGPMGGQQNYAAAQGQDQALQAKAEKEQEARLQAAIQRLGGIAQGAMTPRPNNGQAGQSMIDNAMRMQPVVSDERSKNKIADLEGQLAAARKSAPDFTKSPNYSYTYKDPTIPGAAPGPQVGPMAQDLERAGSQAVMNTPNGKMVDPSRLVMETAGAVGEVQGQTNDLKRQFAELEAMLKADGKRKQQSAGAY
jgi:hypothetical protein